MFGATTTTTKKLTGLAQNNGFGVLPVVIFFDATPVYVFVLGKDMLSARGEKVPEEYRICLVLEVVVFVEKKHV